ncbi:ferredoxin [Rhodococcus jostii]|uniref:ferredoxin n=1 Tax=Rhodococcus jostii TaxID=132919 RepID=UPI00365A9292
MRVEVDRSRCEGHAMCESVAPTFFSVDDDGALIVLQDDVAEDDKEAVQTATVVCPVAALKLI